MSSTFQRPYILTCLVLSLLLTLVSCGSLPRLPAPKSFAGAQPDGVKVEVRSTGMNGAQLSVPAPVVLQRLRAASPDGTINSLARSGGGAGGAFGAGVLAGMSRRGDRPPFEIVTGVSAGALIAPFAFLGPSWDAELTKALAGADTASVLQRRTIDILFRPSLYRGKPLADFVHHMASDDLIGAVARESETGRLLLVATTDLDKGTMILWNMGAIAAQNTPASRTLFRDVLLASTSIPAIFPPVLIRVESNGRSYDEMHVDGGTTVPFFVAPEIAHILPGQIAGLGGTNLYVLMNTQLGQLPDTVTARLGPIVERSFTAVLNAMARKELQVALSFARANGMNFHVTSIPIDYPFGGAIDFAPGHMRALFEYGERCAEQGMIWTTPSEALRRAQTAIDRSSANPPLPAAKVPCPLENE